MRIFGCWLVVLLSLSLNNKSYGQENYLSGIELSIDQDRFSDFLQQDENNENRNYAISLRLGIYGELANNPVLGLPWVRQIVDGFFIDRILENRGFRQDRKSHNFTFEINGFSPSLISDEVPGFQDAILGGYDLALDRPFSSFTGFRSSRRLEGNKLFVHSARQLDLAVTTSFTAGFASFGIVKGVENLFGGGRPDGNLWDRNENAPYPTGQIVLSPVPMLMYSISAEAVVWRPIKQVLLQVRPEVNLGYYTNIGLGFDFGKVMNVEKHIDNLSYTDNNNPGLIVVNNDHFGISIVSGGTARLVLYNEHINGLYKFSKGDNYITFGDTRKFVFEGYVGVKLQLFKKVEFNFSVTQRTKEFKNDLRSRPMWGTFGFKYLLGEEGEGCYD
ncbi:lipid A deacylase LpxR family protein [Saprospiraceae bacterium]|nr:lipid A deacylase LpxR family protein [Saprospiraceae bacterium]